MNNIKKTDEELFNWVIEYEDELLSEIREKVISKAKYNYGERGRDIAVRYYKQLDGEEDYNLSVDENCNDCKERAKKLIEISNFIGNATSILTDEKLSQLTKKINYDLIANDNNLKNVVESILNESLFEIDEKTKENILVRILLEFCKRTTENDSSS